MADKEKEIYEKSLREISEYLKNDISKGEFNEGLENLVKIASNRKFVLYSGSIAHSDTALNQVRQS